MKGISVLTGILICIIAAGSGILIPMDNEQNDHLRAYGIVYNMLQQNVKSHWLLGYRGGAFIIESSDAISLCTEKGVSFFEITDSRKSHILSSMEKNGQKAVLLEKAPRIAVYSPPDKDPWDDAVTLALEYASIEYDVIYDTEILNGKLYKYDWLHLHHEDFTGQFDRFYMSAFNTPWFQKMYKRTINTAQKLGYSKYWIMKRDVAGRIAGYVEKGGFLFSMCSGTNSLDIALAIGNQDNIPAVLDNDGMESIEPDYSRTMAFEGFELNNSSTLNLADINYEPPERMLWQNQKFKLRVFAPLIDPVEAMLTQNHRLYIDEFLGRTTAYRKQKIRGDVVILADACDNRLAKYIHGNYGKGFFTFFAGHDPEDYVHYVNDPPTDLNLHRNSPGYRLILNNVLFPASGQKKKKT
ncbi:MAG: asparagine synthetase B [bacterium]